MIKPDDKKYGDLILWYQIIDKAKECKKPIILVSGDVKEDWWSEKGGKRLMPLPQLKKELFEKAGVDFHIYTADRFLEYYTKEQKKTIDKKTISEVRKVRELEEKRMMLRRMQVEEMHIREMQMEETQMRKFQLREIEKEPDQRLFERCSMEFLQFFEITDELMMRIRQGDAQLRYKEEFNHLYRRINEFRNRVAHGGVDEMTIVSFYKHNQEISFVLKKLAHSEELKPELSMRIREALERLEQLNHRLSNFIK